MTIPFYPRGLARLGMRASAPSVLLIPILFVSSVLVARRAGSAPVADELYVAASSDDRGAMREAIRRLADLDARDHCGYTPLALMSTYGRHDAVELLLARGAAVDLPHPLLGTPLMLALRNGNVKIARALLEHGADVDACCAGYDPLASAVAANSTECVRLVLAAGADPCSTDRRYNLLTLAVQPGDLTVMRLLLAAGVEPNLPDSDGKTPLIHAVESGMVECARLLLEAGADSTRPGADGLTPRDIAQRRGSRTMIELLESVKK